MSQFFLIIWLCKCRKSQVSISEFKGEKRSTKGNHKIHGQEPEQRSVQVLLLLIQHGANGLNLLEAKHVILVEPLLNPAVEAQAISRVHRIGQKNRTIAHRFIVCVSLSDSLNKGTLHATKHVCNLSCYFCGVRLKAQLKRVYINSIGARTPLPSLTGTQRIKMNLF